MKESVKKWLGEQMAGMDEEMIAGIYAEYGETAVKLYKELCEKRAAGADFETVDRVAHTLKGNALMVGDQALFEAVQAWRAAIKEGGLAAGDPIWEPIGREVAAIDGSAEA